MESRGEGGAGGGEVGRLPPQGEFGHPTPFLPPRPILQVSFPPWGPAVWWWDPVPPPGSLPLQPWLPHPQTPLAFPPSSCPQTPNLRPLKLSGNSGLEA